MRAQIGQWLSSLGGFVVVAGVIASCTAKPWDDGAVAALLGLGMIVLGRVVRGRTAGSLAPRPATAGRSGSSGIGKGAGRMPAPSRNSWGGISFNIARQFETARHDWFAVWVELLEQQGSQARVQRRRLEGRGECAVKAYQLYILTGVMAQHEYIPPSDGSDFADILFAQVCGTHMRECMAFFARYDEGERRHGGGTRIFRFARDMVEYITGADIAQPPGALAVGQTLPLFAAHIHGIVAASFGDANTAREMEQLLEAA